MVEWTNIDQLHGLSLFSPKWLLHASTWKWHWATLRGFLLPVVYCVQVSGTKSKRVGVEWSGFEPVYHTVDKRLLVGMVVAMQSPLPWKPEDKLKLR